MKKFTLLIAILLLGGVFIFPIILQPDLGTACVFAVTLLIVFASFIRITYPMAGILAALPCCGMIIVHKFPHAMRRLAMYQDALLLHIRTSKQLSTTTNCRKASSKADGSAAVSGRAQAP